MTKEKWGQNTFCPQHHNIKIKIGETAMGYVNSVLSNPAFQVFLIAMIGYIIGRIKIKGIEVGDAGILIVSLIAGHFGVTRR